MPAGGAVALSARARLGIVALAAAAVIALPLAGWRWAAGRAPEALPDACIAAADRPTAPGSGMVWIPGGALRMGSESDWPEEAPLREVTVGGFWIDVHDVTNAEFARFVAATGYVTVAERKGAAGLRQGALVFSAPTEVRDLADLSQWWRLDPKADWRHPQGRGSDLAHRQNHPVVDIAYEDAEAYARWAGHHLPSEAEWELAARGGRDGQRFAWGNDPDSAEAPLANTWRGVFPVLNLGSKGFKGTSPVGCFPPNGFGLYDMAGNVWQWTRDPWTPDHARAAAGTAGAGHVIKGGSFLCAANFCLRYRPAARQPGDDSAGASHLGFRTVLAGPPPAEAR